MAENKSWKGCDACGMKTRNTRIFKGRFLCIRCFRKNITIIPGQNQIFSEPLTKCVNCPITLTLTQEKKLYKRLKYLYPQHNRKICRLKGLSNYIRSLILSDLTYQK